MLSPTIIVRPVVKRKHTMRHFVRKAEIAGLALMTVSARAQAPASVGRTFYVDFERGADTNTGDRPERPFRRSPGDPEGAHAAAAVQLQPGDRVVFRGGIVYRGALNLAATGAPDRPIVFDGNTAGDFGGGRAILDGAVTLTDWTRVTLGESDRPGAGPGDRVLYRAFAPRGVTGPSAHLHWNGRLLTLAQHPAPTDPLAVDDHSRYLRVPPGRATATTIRDERLTALGGAALIGAYAMVWRSANDIDTRRITAWDAATQTITFEKLRQPPYTNQDTRYSIVNAPTPSVLSAPGMYVVLDAQPAADGRVAVLLWPPDGADPNRAEVTASLRDHAFSLGPDVGHLTIQGFLIRNYRGAVRKLHWGVNRSTSHITIRDNEITGIRAQGYDRAIYVFRVDDFRLEDNYFHDCPQMRGAAAHTAERPVFRNNRLERMGRTPLTFFNTRDGRIIGNRIENNTGTHSNGLSVYEGSRDTLIEGNIVRNSNIALTLNRATNAIIRNNVFDGGGRNQPISFWENVTGEVVVEHNTLINGGKASGLYLGGLGDRDGRSFAGLRLIVRNNIMDGPVQHIMRGSNPIWTQDIENRHNLYRAAPAAFVPGPGERVIEDFESLFRDFRAGDYRLRPGSPAIDAGQPGGTDRDVLGVPRPQGAAPDIGAYEFVPDAR